MPDVASDQPSSRYLFAACCTLEASHEPEDLDRATEMLARYGLTYATGIEILIARGVLSA